MEDIGRLTEATEKEWLEIWSAGPGEKRPKVLDIGSVAPEIKLLDHNGLSRQLS